jgi:hypothetical protein
LSKRIPPDEQFTKLELDEIILNDDTLTLMMTVYSRTGSVQVLTPPIPLR